MFFITYLRRELRRRMRQAIFIALGLALGIGLVVTVTAASAGVPTTLVDGLAPGGILVAPVGEDHHDQQLLRIRRNDDGFSTEDLGLVRFVPLVAGLPRRSGSRA